MPTIDQLQSDFDDHQYVADRDLATALFLALKLERPLLLEGEAGVGKTEVALTLAAVLDTELIRLQCYEGLDVNTAVYEWDYPRQMLEIRLLEAKGEAKSAATRDIFGEEFLIRRPLIRVGVIVVLVVLHRACVPCHPADTSSHVGLSSLT